MKTTKLLVIASIAAAASFGAMAQTQGQEGSPLPQNFAASTNRAQVQSELAAYKQAGVNPWSTSFNQLKGFQSQRSRADVRAEFLASRNEVAALNGEDSGSAYLTQLAARHLNLNQNLAGQPVNTAK
jgi:hypothetical protein